MILRHLGLDESRRSRLKARAAKKSFRVAQTLSPMPLSFPRFGHLLVGQALGLRRAPRPAPRQFCKIRRARLGAARRRSVCPTKT